MRTVSRCVVLLTDSVDGATFPVRALYEYNGGISSITPLVDALKKGAFPVRALYEYGGGLSCFFVSFCGKSSWITSMLLLLEKVLVARHLSFKVLCRK